MIMKGFIRQKKKFFAISFPGLFTLVSPFEEYDYEGFYQAKKEVLQELSDFLNPHLHSIFERFSKKPYSKDQNSKGERALKNTCLSFLAYSSEDISDLLVDQFTNADNMTDQIKALALLSKTGGEKAEKCLEIFAEKWKENPIVMNKWFAVQAMSERPDILNTIKELEKSEYFDKTNPNKIRSLFGVFGRNYPFFHKEDGTGYEFIAEKIIQIDAFNQKASSSLAQVFRQYSKLDVFRKEKMKVVLEKILTKEKISPALFEVVNAIVG